MAVRTSVTSNLTNTALDKLREQSAAELPTRQGFGPPSTTFII